MLADSAFVGSGFIQHPTNPMMSSVLQCTAHLRPREGGFPMFFVDATSASAALVVTSPSKKQASKERAGITKCNHPPIRMKVPFEDQIDRWELKQATILAKMQDGRLSNPKQVIADLTEIGVHIRYLKEKARVESVGGQTADEMVKVQKMMAEESGGPDWLLP